MYEPCIYRMREDVQQEQHDCDGKKEATDDNDEMDLLWTNRLYHGWNVYKKEERRDSPCHPKLESSALELTAVPVIEDCLVSWFSRSSLSLPLSSISIIINNIRTLPWPLLSRLDNGRHRRLADPGRVHLPDRQPPCRGGLPPGRDPAQGQVVAGCVQCVWYVSLRSN